MAYSTQDYTTVASLSGYLPDVNSSSNSAIWTTLIHAASRFIDHVTGQWFFPEGVSTRFFNLVDASGNMQGNRQVSTYLPFCPNKIGTIAPASVGATSLTYSIQTGPAPAVNDSFAIVDGMNSEDVTVTAVSGTGPYTLTCAQTLYAHGANVPAWQQITVVLGYYENQPRSQWLTLNGDGIVPPSNFFFWPPNPRTYSSNGTAYLKPWWGVDLAHVPSPNTQFLPVAIGGYKTMGITANWGWPAVPDIITDLTNKLCARSWQALTSGHKLEIGQPELGGVTTMARHFDEKDLEILISSDLVATAL